MKAAATFFILILLLTLTPVAASDLSIVGGWTGVGSFQSTAGEIDLHNFGALGLRFEKGLPFIGFESNLMYYPNALCSCNEGGDSAVSYTGGLVVTLPIIKPSPFVTAGVGGLSKIGDRFPDFGSSFVVSYGGGLKADRLFGPVGLRVDFRRLRINDVLEDHVTINEVTGGIMISF